MIRSLATWGAILAVAGGWLGIGPASADGEIVIRLDGRKPAESTPAKTTAQPPANNAKKAGSSTGTPATSPTALGRLGRVKQGPISIRLAPKAGSRGLIQVVKGQYLVVRGQTGSWYAVLMQNSTLGYVPQSSLELLDYNVTKLAQPTTARVTTAQVNLNAIREAYRYMGVKYVWGGNGFSGVDCSGLVKNCFSAQGVKLPRRASHQARVGRVVPLDQLQPGDRLYFSVKKQYDHTGIYLGNGYFIHASSSRGKVAVDHLSKKLYGTNLTAARRF